jgi:predicted small secreted protein
LSAGRRPDIEPDHREEFMLRKIAISALALAALTLGGCNAVKGLGRDIESVGQAGDRAT